jgi:hypothetical protein
MDRLDSSNAKDAERIPPMILSDDASNDDSIYDETESHEDYMEPREGISESAEEAASDDDCCNEVDATDNCFIGKDKAKLCKVNCTTQFDADGKIF